MGKSERDLDSKALSAEQLGLDREQPTIASDPPEPKDSGTDSLASSTNHGAAPTIGPDPVPVRDVVPELAVTPKDLLVGLPEELATHPRYCPLELLGQGGMGSVFKASHRVMDRVVALKVIRPELSRPDIVERFRREIRAAAKLSHPNIVTAHDAEQAGDVHFLVVEYVDGSSLDRMVARDGAMSIQQACSIVRQVAEGLQHAYEVGMVHRDIKPQNIMCTATGLVKILDFGLALVYSDASNTSALTQGGGVMGTPDYIAPEQANDAHAADTRSDIYSLGCTLYFLLRGKPPFSDGSIIQKLMAHMEKDPPSLLDFRQDIPTGLLRVLGKAMAKRPDDRFQTPMELQQALRPFCEGWDPDEDLVIPTLVAPVFVAESFEKPPIRSSSESRSGGHDSWPSRLLEHRRDDSPSQWPAGGSSAGKESGSDSGSGRTFDSRAGGQDASMAPADSMGDVWGGRRAEGGISYAPAPSSSAPQAFMSPPVSSSAVTADHRDLQHSNWTGRVALFIGFFTLVFAWIPCVGWAMLPFSCIGLGMAVFSIVMSWGIPEARVRLQVAAAIICSVSIAVSALSGFILSSMSG